VYVDGVVGRGEWGVAFDNLEEVQTQGTNPDGSYLAQDAAGV
jgi:hypothetical protein